MYWATTTFRADGSPELIDALRAWRDHIEEGHPKIREVRCYRYDAGTSIVWQEGFNDFRDYQDLIEEEDDTCERVMAEVFRYAIPGTREGRIWSDVV